MDQKHLILVIPLVISELKEISLRVIIILVHLQAMLLFIVIIIMGKTSYLRTTHLMKEDMEYF